MALFFPPTPLQREIGMSDYILTRDGRRVTATARPLFRDDVMFSKIDGRWHKFVAVGTDYLEWRLA